MFKLADLMLTMTFVATAMGQVGANVTTRHDHGLSAKTELGEVVITACEELVEVTDPQWNSGKGSLLVLFDSASGYFHWRLAAVPKSTTIANLTGTLGTTGQVYVASDRFLLIGFGYHVLQIEESRKKANSLDDAEAKALAEVKDRLSSIITTPFKTEGRLFVNLA
jgi:hypothetical protein